MLNEHLIAKTRPIAVEKNIVVRGDIRVTVLTECLFRIESDVQKKFCDEATQSVWYRDFPETKYEVREEKDELHIVTRKATLVVTPNVYKSYVVFSDGLKVAIDNKNNLLGTYRTLDCYNGDQHISYENGKRKSTPINLEPGVMSRDGVAMIDDSKSLVLGENGFLSVRENEEIDLYVFAYGHSYRDALKALYKLCGQTPLIPRYAFGNWWSRYHVYTQKEYLHLMDKFAKQEIPFTVATVDMDWHWSEKLDEQKQITASGKNDELHGGADGWTGYSWNTELFPDYKAFLKQLHDKNLRVTLNLHPALGVRYFEDQYEEMAKELGIDPSTQEQIKFNITNEDFVNAYFKILHKPYEHDGVDFWWIDWQQGSESGMKGLDPLWALNHYHYLDNGLEHQPLILSRYCGIGSHRYPLGFSGDTHVTWDTMEYIPYFTSTASNAGYTWWSHDIGGHMNGYKDDELYLRFIQFGVFSPINRLHCSNSVTFTKEPQAYKNGTGKIAEEFLKLRHKMIPFLYSASYENMENGVALIEPMYYAYPEKEEAYNAKKQYMFGGQLLVAPVTSKSEAYGMSVTSVWLPEGKWTDIFTGEKYEGNNTVDMVRYMDTIPVLAKEGGIFVLDGRSHTNSVENPDKLEVLLFRGNGSYVLHEDEDNIRKDTSFIMEEIDTNTQRLYIETTARTRSLNLAFKDITTGSVVVTADGVEVEADVDDNENVTVLIDKLEANKKYEITVTFEDNKEERFVEFVRNAVTCMEYDNDVKNDFYYKLINNIDKYRSLVEESKIPEIYKKRFIELLHIS